MAAKEVRDQQESPPQEPSEKPEKVAQPEEEGHKETPYAIGGAPPVEDDGPDK